MYKNMGKVKRTLEEYAILTVATLILVVGVYVFKFPNNFSFGGVTAVSYTHLDVYKRQHTYFAIIHSPFLIKILIGILSLIHI